MSVSLQTSPHLERLPSELLRQIFEQLFPCSLAFTLSHRYASKGRRLKWTVQTESSRTSIDSTTECNRQQSWIKAAPRMYASLMLTSKTLSREARAMLYSDSQFVFLTRVPLLKGKLPRTQQKVLRNVKDIRIELDTKCEPKQLEQYLNCFVDTVNANNKDSSGMSLLRRLDVQIMLNDEDCDYDYLASTDPNHDSWGWSPTRRIEGCMYTLEILARLPKLEIVKISGPPRWFSECLKLYMQGGGGTVEELCRLPKKVKKTKTHPVYYESSRHDGEPIHDWEPFARHNSIEMPEKMINYYQRHSAQRPYLGE